MDISKRPMHMRQVMSIRTYCGVEVNGYTIRYTYNLKDVTCKRCLVVLKNHCQCPKCENIFKS